MEPAQTDVQPKPGKFSPARVVVLYIAVAVLSITVCMIAARFAVVGHELNYTLMDRGRTPLFGELALGIGAILGLAAAIIWCQRIVTIERATNRAPKPIVSAVVLALIATVVLHLSLMLLQAYLRNAPLQASGSVFGAIFGIPAALISGITLGGAGYYALTGETLLNWNMLPTVMRMFAPLLGKVPPGHLLYLLGRLRNEKPHRFGHSVRVNTFYPPYPSPAYDRFIDNIATRRRAPYSAYISAAAACPWNCPHCSHGGRDGTPLSDAAILSAIVDLKQIGACTVGFTGGEPLLRGSLETLIRACGPELATIVFTSGAGLGPARARSLAAAGVACVTVGVESSNGAEHDRVRGVDGSFVQCMSAAKACADAGVYLAISTIATREKLAGGELERVYSLARELGAGELRVLSPVPTGSAAGCGQFCLTAEERETVAQFHGRHNREPDGPAVAAFAYLESPEMFGCGAGYHHLYIDAYGNVCPCDLTPLSFGNLAERRLADIYANMAEHFSRPRRQCIMRTVKMPAGPLPLSPAVSARLCPKATRFDPLPDGYRRLGI